jgi:hypothetical protein
MKIYLSLSKNLIDDVKTKLSKIVSGLTSDLDVTTWTLTVFKNYVVNEAPSEKVNTLSEDAPAWAKQALAKGELEKVIWNKVTEKLSPIIDYLHHLKAVNEKFTRLAVNEAWEKQILWHEELAKLQTDSLDVEEDGVCKVYTYPDGYYWLRLYGEESLNKEGNAMGHCVGGYFTMVSDGKTSVFSLRDPKNKPHVTIEFKLGKIKQIQGKADSSTTGQKKYTVIPKYRQYIPPFLHFLEPDYISIGFSGFKETELLKIFKENDWIKTVKPNDKKILLSMSTTSGKDILLTKEFNYITIPTISTKYDHTDDEDLTLVFGDTEISNINPFFDVKKLENLDITVAELAALYISLYKYLDLRRACTNVEVLKYLCPVVGNYGQILKLKATEDSNLIFKQDIDFLLLKNDKLYGYLYNVNRYKLINSRAIEKDDMEFLQTVDTNTLPKIVQMKIASWKSKISSKDLVSTKRKKGIDYRSTPAILAKALKEFTKPPLVIKAAESLNRAKTIEDMKNILKKENGLELSGYLYSYFEAFFSIALMKNKDLQIEYILSNTSMLKQFVAFTSSLNSIKVGAFYYLSKRADTIEQSWKVISEHMNLLFPINEREKDLLLSTRSTPSFKKIIGSWEV